MSSTCFELDGSSSGRRVYVQLWCSVFYRHQYEPSGSERVEDIKQIKNYNINLERVHFFG